MLCSCLIAFPEGEGRHGGVDLAPHVAPKALTSPCNQLVQSCCSVLYDYSWLQACKLGWLARQPLDVHACMGEFRVRHSSEWMHQTVGHASLLVNGSVWWGIRMSVECMQTMICTGRASSSTQSYSSNASINSAMLCEVKFKGLAATTKMSIS